MNTPLHDQEEQSAMRRDLASLKYAAWTGVALLACALAAVMIEVKWFRSNFTGVVLILASLALLLPWLGKWYYRGAKAAVSRPEQRGVPARSRNEIPR